MNTDPKTQETGNCQNNKTGILVAIIFILVGILFLARNTGFLAPDVFSLIVSWPSLLIFWGIVTLFSRHLVGGTILIGVGIYFLFPELNWITNDLIRVYWPVGFIILGLSIMLGFRKGNRKNNMKHFRCRHFGAMNMGKGGTEEGYVTIDSSFNAVKHIVFDPVFKGAEIDLSFGGAILDLRKTTLVEPETVINIDCSFAGLTLYVPKGSLVRLQLDSNLSGCQDLRNETEILDKEHILYIRGDLSFSGLEIRD